MKKDKKCFMRLVKGFTLAEVLITLTVLGVVAAISISLITNFYKKTMTIARLKVAYSMLDNMTRQSYVENGYPYGIEVNNSNFNKYFGKYLNISKNCGKANTNSSVIATGCFKQAKYKNSNSATEYIKDENGKELKTDMIYTLDGKSQYTNGYSPRWYHKVVLKNGMGLATWYSNVSVPKAGVIFLVDIDGPNKGESKLGQDVFAFNYQASRESGRCNSPILVPGASTILDIDSNCNISRNNLIKQCKQNGTSQAQNWNGMGCSGLIIKDGWKISSDYPWGYANKK